MPGLHPFPALACLRVVTFVQTPKRTMSFETFWAPATSPVAAADMLAIANEVHGAIGPLVTPLINDVCYVPTHYIRYTDETHDYDAWATDAALQGHSSTALVADTDWEPSFMCGLIRRKTNKPGRTSRGRLFIPGLSEDMVDQGALSSDGKAALKALADFLGADRTWNGTIFHARHWSRKTNDLMVVTQCLAMDQVYTRRDRSRGQVALPVT